MMAWSFNLVWSDRVSHTTLEIATNNCHFNFSINKLHAMFQQDTNYTVGALAKTFVKLRASALFWRSLVDTQLQCKYCFEMQHCRNCLHWLWWVARSKTWESQKPRKSQKKQLAKQSNSIVYHSKTKKLIHKNHLI